MPHRNEVRVLPDPVGARMRVWFPDAMAGHPRSWASVGAGNGVWNQVLTGPENRLSAAMTAAYEPPTTAGPFLEHRHDGGPRSGQPATVVVDAVDGSATLSWPSMVA